MHASEVLSQIRKILHRWEPLGSQRMENGAVCVARVQRRGSQSWLHCIMGPAPKAELARLQFDFPGLVPREYLELLSVANGMMLFSRRLSIYGLRTSYDRSPNAPIQPFEVRIPNSVERLSTDPDDAFLFGSYAENGDRLASFASTGEVVRFSELASEPLQSWPSLAAMLLGEVERYALLCDHEGRMHPSTFGA
jgi:hypothetical protein